MAARKWTQEQRAAQSKAIHTWEPWKHSTGPSTPTGKGKVSRNAYRGGVRKFVRFSNWVSWALKHPETLTPEIVEAAKHRSVELCGGFTEWVSEAEEKLIEQYGLR